MCPGKAEGKNDYFERSSLRVKKGKILTSCEY